MRDPSSGISILLRHLVAAAGLLMVVWPVTSLAQTLSVSSTNISTTIERWQNATNTTLRVGISNTGGLAKFYWLQHGVPWLSLSPSSGTSTGELDTVTFSFVTTSLDPGTNTAEILVVAPAATNSPLSVWVSVIVNDDGGTNRAVRVSPSCRGVPGYRVNLPVELISQGDENALAFSFSYDKSVFSSPAVTIGPSVSGGYLLTNTSQTSSGRIGISVANAIGATFSAGICTVAVVSLTVNVAAAPKGYSFSFGSTPVVHQVSDANAYALSSLWPTGCVSIFGGYESEILPRSTGTLAAVVTLADWVQVGRFSAGLDTITYPAEFQRADCAPRDTLGDGILSVIDWVQAGRYYNGDDVVVEAGGPISNQIASINLMSAPMVTFDTQFPIELQGSTPARLFSLATGPLTKGATNVVTVNFTAVGNENAVAFNVGYDPAVLKFISAEALLSGALIALRTGEVDQGKVGITTILQPGQHLVAGQQSIVQIKFSAVSGFESESTTFGFADDPVTKAVVSVTAQNLTAAYAADLPVTLNGQPDTESPSIAIDNPTGPTAVTIDPTFSLAGRASDNWRVAAVICTNDARSGGVCSGSSNWTASVPLTIGTNRVSVTAVDPAGNRKAADVTVVYVMTREEAAADDDGDGVCNWYEFLSGTDRKDSNSVLKLIENQAALDSEPGSFRIGWQSVPGKKYGVYRTTDLLGAFERIGEVVAVGNISWYIDVRPAGAVQCFYRVMVE